MAKKHLKRLATNKSWPIKRKEMKYITRPNPSGHRAALSTSLNTVLKEMLQIAKSTKEVRYALHNKEVLIDGIKRKDHKFATGLFDVISIKESNDNFRVLLNKNGKLSLIKIDKKEACLKPCKIIGKTHLKGKKLQLNLNDGKNIFVTKDDVKVGDSLIISLPDQKIREIIKLDKGSKIFLTGGSHIGFTGTVEKIYENTITLKSGKERFKTLKKHAFAINEMKFENE